MRTLGVLPEQVLVTSGSDIAIEHILRTVVEDGGRAVLPVPPVVPPLAPLYSTLLLAVALANAVVPRTWADVAPEMVWGPLASGRECVPALSAS